MKLGLARLVMLYGTEVGSGEGAILFKDIHTITYHEKNIRQEVL